MQPTMQEAEGISMIMQMQQAVMKHIFTIDATVLSKNAKQQLHFMQLRMRKIIQFSPRLTQRRYTTCAVRLVVPASNEPYIQYRALKRERLNKHNIVNNMFSKRY